MEGEKSKEDGTCEKHDGLRVCDFGEAGERVSIAQVWMRLKLRCKRLKKLECAYQS